MKMFVLSIPKSGPQCDGDLSLRRANACAIVSPLAAQAASGGGGIAGTLHWLKGE